MRTIYFLAGCALACLLFASPAQAATFSLQPPNGFALLGVSCGGVHVSTFAIDFNTTDGGNPENAPVTIGVLGEVYAWTRCGYSGRGGGYRSTTYRKWVLASWNLDGTLVGTFPMETTGIVSAYDEYLKYAPVRTDAAGNAIWTEQVSTSYRPAYVGKVATP